MLQYLNKLKKRKEQVKFFIDNVFECCLILEEVLIGRSIVVFLLVEKILIDKLIGFEKFDIDKLLDIVLLVEEFDLQVEILELKEKIDRIIKKIIGIDVLNVLKGNI